MRLLLVPIVIVSLWPASLAWAEEPVYFTDEVLKTAVEDALWVWDPTPTDMLALTKLVCVDSGVTDLTGLAYAKNLQHLNLRFNNISDISRLSGLTDLRHLDLSRNYDISNISSLAGMTHLDYLNLHINRIEKISALSGMHELTYLDLHGNRIVDISALAELTHLTQLQMQANPLNAEACQIYLPLILENNPGVDLEYDACAEGYSLTISSSPGGAVTEPGEGARTYTQVETLSVVATTIPGYHFACWTGTAVGAGKVVNPQMAQTTVTVDDAYTLKGNFTRDIIHVDDDAPLDPHPHDLHAGDPSKDGTAEHPFDSIQEAISAASPGVLVLVQPGTYLEALDLMGKDIQLSGMDPNRAEIMPLPVIQGGDTGRIVTFAQAETRMCQFSGFVLTRGHAGSGAAIACLGSSPTIHNCLIIGNRSDDPRGAIVLCQDSSPVFENLTVHGNRADDLGGAFRFIDSPAVIRNSILWIYPRTSAGSKTVLQKGISGAEDYRFELFGGQHPTFSFGNSGNSVVLYADSVLPTHEWAHVTLVRASHEAALYINGARRLSKTFDFAPPATDYPLIIGGSDASCYAGKIDDVRIYGLALGAKDIQSIISETE